MPNQAAADQRAARRDFLRAGLGQTSFQGEDVLLQVWYLLAASTAAGEKGGTLSLGKNVDAKRNLGLVGMSIAFTGNPMGSATVTANQGKVYINDGGATATPKFGSSGTIKGTSGGIPYTVSWNCGGAPSKG